MWEYALRRILGAIPTIFIILTISFFLIRMAPGGPFDVDKALPAEVQKNLNEKYHLDDPLLVQYGQYMLDLFKGDLGPSFQYKDYTVNELIGSGFPVSLQLGLSAIALAILVGVVIGATAASRQNSWLDHLIMSTAMVGISIPNFVMAPILILIFAVTFQWLPAGGWESGNLANMLLPVIVLALPQIAYIARITRGSMIEVLRTDFIRTARSKGLPERYILFRHAIKPAMLPVVSYLGPATAGIITGSVVVEQIFNIPGLGRFFVQGALNRDYTLVMGVVLFFAILIVLFNLIVDLIYSWLDPEIRYKKLEQAK